MIKLTKNNKKYVLYYLKKMFPRVSKPEFLIPVKETFYNFYDRVFYSLFNDLLSIAKNNFTAVNQIIFGVGFLTFAYIFRVNSIWNDSKADYRRFDKNNVVVDVWNKKSTTDFFHYLKFEYI